MRNIVEIYDKLEKCSSQNISSETFQVKYDDCFSYKIKKNRSVS